MASGVIDQRDDLVAAFLVDQRPEGDALIEAVAHLQRGHPGGQLLGERVLHRLVDVEAVGGGAGLAHVAHLGDHGAIDGGIDVGILEDDEGRIAAEFHGRVDDAVGGLVQELAADLGRAGEGDDADARVVQHGGNHLA